jgi:hypothetical protein
MSSEITEAEFIDIYGEAPITFRDQSVPLTTLLQMEAAFCTGQPEARQDPEKRVGYLAKLVGDNLLPEHEHLRPESD